jgi:hypothetical protein
MQKPKFLKLTQICFYLIRGFCSVFVAVLLMCVLLGVFGAHDNAMFLLTTTWPWLLRSTICIGCALAVTSLSEAL